MIPTGTPAAANTSAASSASASWASGEMAQISEDSGGRARTASSDPPITRAISTACRAITGSTTVSLWTCFTVFEYDASSSWTGAVAGWSPALTIGQ